MNWETVKAILAIALPMLLMGVALYIPAHFWVKRKLRTERQIAIYGPNSPIDTDIEVTKTGFIVFGFLVGVGMFGVSLEYLAPESTLGQFVSLPGGKALYGLCLVLVFMPVITILEKAGIKILTRKKKKDV